ncbi:MAG: helix-turn-helix transcriptional regulator [Peptostreptococcaceae bacterium]|nr:helix-turn-helix transcriptional regulator [Peptostreptococcaceae bacterium]
MVIIKFTKRQKEIIEILRNSPTPVTSEEIAHILGVTKSALRSDLSVLTQTGTLTGKPKVGYVLSMESNFVNQEYAQRSVSDVMSVAVIIDEKQSVASSIVRIFLEDVGSIFVIGEKGLSGIVSRKDLVKAMMGNSNLEALPVSMIMTRMPNVITIREDATISEAVRKLIVHEIDSLPVVKNHNGRVEIVGRFTKTNATKLFAELINPKEVDAE